MTRSSFTHLTLLNSLLAVFISFSTLSTTLMVAQETLTPEMVAKIETVTGAAVSGEGDHVAYTLSVPADPFKENKSAENHLYIYDTDSEHSSPYFTRGSVSSVVFRPGHNAVTFLSKKDGDSKTVLYEVSTDGGEAQVLCEFDRSISSYSWSPDGESLVFTMVDEMEKGDADMPYTAKVYEENQSLKRAYVVNLANKKEPRKLAVKGSLNLTEWSPDGDQIAVSTSPTAGVDDFYMAQKVKIVDVRSGEVAAEINNQGKLGQIVWSPDGSQIALRAAADIHDPTDGRIMLASVEGGSPEILDTEFEGKYEHISWVSTGDIVFLASQSTSSIIGKINPGSAEKEIWFEGGDYAVGSMAHTDDGQVYFVASRPVHPAELFALPSSSSAQRLTHHNEWLEDLTLGDQEVVSYKARDGKYEIDGILVHPIENNDAGPAPTITVVHGGPESHYLNGWLTGYSMPGQMAAGEGYAVFYPNYRGSTGRGIDFAYSSQGDLSGAEFDDVVDGVDYLIEEGISDEDRIGVTGGSYGGYASAWMSTYYSDRFAAAVMFVGISNNLSKWGTSDIPEELFLVHARKRIWDDWEGYLKRSPVYYVDRAQTPILIMHGEEDTRVHPGQSLELYRHLKVRKPEVPARLVWYPGEGHGNRKSTARYDYSVRMMRWFDTYLKTGDADAELPSWQAPVEKDK